MNQIQTRYWLCWSSRQNCFHIESEEVGLRTNQRAFAMNAGVDFVPIAVFLTREAATAAAGPLHHILDERTVLFGMPPEVSEN